MSKLITRRSALLSLTACACCLPGAISARAAEKSGADSAAGHNPHWGYEGSGSPEHWGELSADFKTCQIGMEQTPIDLNGGVKAQFDKPFSLDYKPVAGKIINNGHTIQVNLEKGCSCTIEGASYDLLQFHFHHPSEHLVSGKPWQMETHLVHKSPEGGLAVIGIFMREGAANSLLAPVFDGMPLAAGGEKALAASLDASGLFPAKRGYYRYMGSLTTPPCSEGLTWTVFKEPIEASSEQIRKFASLFPNNARPVQNRNRRFLLEGGI
jgi:carbonic anhydrase